MAQTTNIDKHKLRVGEIITNLHKVHGMYRLLLQHNDYKSKLIVLGDIDKYFQTVEKYITKFGIDYTVSYVKASRHAIFCYLARYHSGRMYRKGTPRVSFRQGGIPTLIPGRLAVGLRNKNRPVIRVVLSLLFIFRVINVSMGLKPNWDEILRPYEPHIDEKFTHFIKREIESTPWFLHEGPFQAKPIICTTMGPNGRSILTTEAIFYASTPRTLEAFKAFGLDFQEKSTWEGK